MAHPPASPRPDRDFEIGNTDAAYWFCSRIVISADHQERRRRVAADGPVPGRFPPWGMLRPVLFGKRVGTNLFLSSAGKNGADTRVLNLAEKAIADSPPRAGHGLTCQLDATAVLA